MSDKLEMPLEQFAEAVAKENARLNERIEELETALRACHSALNVAFEYDGYVFGFAHNDAVDADILASKALETKND